MRIRDWSSDVCSSDLVYDNASSDRTGAVAAAAGAVVVHEPLRGKGNVVRRMFADVEADVYVLADGDDTYDAAAAPQLIETLCREQLAMVNAARSNPSQDAYRRGHPFGHRLCTQLVCGLFATRLHDNPSAHPPL